MARGGKAGSSRRAAPNISAQASVTNRSSAGLSDPATNRAVIFRQRVGQSCTHLGHLIQPYLHAELLQFAAGAPATVREKKRQNAVRSVR